MAKVIVYLRDQDMAALNDLAQREYRAPKAQAALIIRRELERLGLIEIAPANRQVKQVGRKISTLDDPIDNRTHFESGIESSEA